MRPFVASLLKCNDCNSEELGKLSISKIQKVPLPTHLPDILAFKNQQGFLMDLIESISKIGGEVIDINEADLYAFLDSDLRETGSKEGAKIADLLYGIDILEGSIYCCSTKCGAKRKIQDGILFYEE